MGFLSKAYNTAKAYGKAMSPVYNAYSALKTGTPYAAQAVGNAASRYATTQGAGGNFFQNLASGMTPTLAHASGGMKFPVGQYNMPAGQIAGNTDTSGGTGGYNTSGGGTAGGGGAGTATTPQETFWMGQKYDFNDPNQAGAYSGARRQYIDQIYGQQLQNLQTQYQQQLEDLTTGETNINKAWQAKDVGTRNYYSAIAPDMYQSAEGQALADALATKEQSMKLSQRERQNTQTGFEQAQGTIGQQKQQEYDQINQILSDLGAQQKAAGISSAAKSIQNYFTPQSTTNTLTANLGLLNQPIGSVQSGMQGGSFGTNQAVNALVAKANAGGQLTPQEQQILQQLGYVYAR